MGSHPVKLLFATKNRGKLVELRKLLPIEGLELLCLEDLPSFPEVEEDGDTFAANACLKARAAMQFHGLAALADDSGLEVDALNGAPGVRSARYAGPGATDEDRYRKLLGELQEVADLDRSARFRCALAFADPEKSEELQVFEGRCEGVIIEGPRGEGGFGYDPVFLVPQEQKTFAELSADTKNAISHRGQAMQAFAQWFEGYLKGETL